MQDGNRPFTPRDMDQASPFPTAMFGAMSIVFMIYVVLMIAVTLTVLIVFWRGMRAHEQIAASLAEVADALRSSNGG